MRREQYAWSALIGLVLIIGISHAQDTRMPLNLNETPTLFSRTPGTVVVDHTRVPLAVPSFGHATTTQDYLPDLLPISEQMYQDRHWGFWLGFSHWNGYSFILTGQSPYWGRHWGTAVTSSPTASTSPIPEPAPLVLLGLCGAWLVTWTRKQRFV